MAISLIANTSNNTNNVTSMVLNVPPGTIDDDIIIFMGSCDGAGYLLPSGFTQVLNVATPGSHVNLLAYRVSSSEPVSYTISSTIAERGWGCFATYRGVDTTNVVDGSTSNTGGSNVTAVITSLLPSTDDCAVVGFVGLESGNSGLPVTTAWPTIAPT